MDPKRLFDFLAASPSCYHAVQALSDRLTQEGYTQLHEADAWTLTAGGKYFVTRNGSSLLAFRVPAGAPAGFLMAAAHTDSPTFKIKHNPEKKAGPYVQLSTEKYGGMLMGTVVRPAAFRRGPRVVTAKDGKLETKLVERRPRSARHPLRRHPHEPRRERRLQAHGERRYASALRHAGSRRQLPRRRGCEAAGVKEERDPAARI